MHIESGEQRDFLVNILSRADYSDAPQIEFFSLPREKLLGKKRQTIERQRCVIQFRTVKITFSVE